MASGLSGSSLLPPRRPPCSVTWGYSLVLRHRLLLLAGSFGVRFPGLGFCQWSGRPCACCPGALQAVHGFLPSGLFPFCLALQVSSPFFILLGPDLSLSLGPSSSGLSPLELSLVGSCVCLGYLRSSGCPSPFVAYLLVALLFCGVILWFALSHLPGGVQLFCFLWRPSGPFFWFVRGVGWSSWLSPLPSAGL